MERTGQPDNTDPSALSMSRPKEEKIQPRRTYLVSTSTLVAIMDHRLTHPTSSGRFCFRTPNIRMRSPVRLLSYSV